MNKRAIALALAIAAIAVTIYYLESMKARPAEIQPGAVDEVYISNRSVEEEYLTGSDYVPDEAATAEKQLKYQKAPELAGITGFVNTQEFTLGQLRGKVVLVDFWTYSCINCIRTQPYLKAWHETYKDDGLVIVGVHTPEFEFEKSTANVIAAMERSRIKYPVVQDNNYATWRAYRNRYWPRKYLIDIDGFIRYDHIGEGAYAETEEMIRTLLRERRERLGAAAEMEKSALVENAADVDFRKVLTPEIYFGYRFGRGGLGNEEGFMPEQVNRYGTPSKAEANKAYLMGEWLNKADYSELISKAGSILLIYAAKRVNIVASSANETRLRIFLDGAEADESVLGTDGNAIEEEKLYNIIETPEYGTHVLEIEAEKGFRIYTFTFG